MWELDLPLVHNSKWNFTFLLFAFSIIEAMHKIGALFEFGPQRTEEIKSPPRH